MPKSRFQFVREWCERKPVGVACFSASGAAFLAALIGAFLNHYLAEVMAVLGMAMVGLFYLALGIWNWNTNETDIGEETAGVDVAESSVLCVPAASVAGLHSPATATHHHAREPVPTR